MCKKGVNWWSGWNFGAVTAKMMGKCKVIIDNKEYGNKLERARCLSISSCKTAVYLVSACFP